MKPAFSVIFLTTLIGAGQGLFLTQFGAQLLTTLRLLPTLDNSDELIAGGIISLLLLVLGLVASFFHLGHPERAWRAVAMWKTSWLSREVIALPIAMAGIFATTASLYLEILSIANHLIVAAFAAFAVLALFVCTAMIYACLKFLRQWCSPLTVCNFFLMGCASGSTLATAIAAAYSSAHMPYYLFCAVTFTVLAGICRYASLLRNKGLRPAANLQSATGIHHPNIRQMAQGAMGGSFNTRRFIHTYAAPLVKLARRYFLLAVFVAPVALLLLWSGSSTLWIPVSAFVIQYSGLLAERWYFFIEADHPQNAYYQVIS